MKLDGEIAGMIVVLSVVALLPLTTTAFTFGAGVVLAATMSSLVSMSVYLRFARP
ncbi:MAG: hypothetical protein K8R36_00210 [Planctomycetales bacterium]|nr:hypothetical protein [Planctomycetales bacterium]